MSVKSMSSVEMIEKLRHLFSNFEIPDKVVSDNGISFSSCEFKEFMDNKGIVHTKVEGSLSRSSNKDEFLFINTSKEE